MSVPTNTKLVVSLPTQTNGVQDILTLVVAAGFNVLTQIRGSGDNEFRNPLLCSNVVLTQSPGAQLGQQIVADVLTAEQTTDTPSATAADTTPAWCACVSRTDIGSLVQLSAS